MIGNLHYYFSYINKITLFHVILYGFTEIQSTSVENPVFHLSQLNIEWYLIIWGYFRKFFNNFQFRIVFIQN